MMPRIDSIRTDFMAQSRVARIENHPDRKWRRKNRKAYKVIENEC